MLKAKFKIKIYRYINRIFLNWNIFFFRPTGSPTTSRASDQDDDHGNDHENYLQTSAPSIDQDKHQEFTSFDNSPSKSPMKESYVKSEDSDSNT